MLSADTNYKIFLAACSLSRPDQPKKAKQQIASSTLGHRRGRREIVYSMHLGEVAIQMGLFKSLLRRMLSLLFWR
jgi:hypothetical protein